MRLRSGSLASAKATCSKLNLSGIPFNLTDAGKHLLTIYPQEAIDIAIFTYTHMNHSFLHKPYGYFIKIIENYCKANNLPINWQLLYKLKLKYGIHHDTPMIKETR